MLEDRKIPGILVLAERGTVILRAGNHMQKPGLKQKSQGTSARYEQPQPPKGLSGYDPEDKDMRGVFMARGPDFIDNPDPQPSIELVDIYEMLCHLMDVKPQPNDGIWERIKNLLRNSAWSITKSAPCMGILLISSYFVATASIRLHSF